MFPFNFQVSGNNCGFWGAIHPTKISGNFGLKLNGSVRSNRESFEKSGPPFEVDLFFRLDRSDRSDSQSQVLAVRYLPCTKWRKILIILWIVNSGSIGVTRTSMYSYDRSVVASQAKCMFWRFTALKDDLFPDRKNLQCSFRHSIRRLRLVFERSVWSHKDNLGTVCWNEAVTLYHLYHRRNRHLL